MATTYSDLDDDGRYDLPVLVRNCSKAEVENRAYELSLEDKEGTRFELVIWESSEEGRACDWEEGCWYHLHGVTANEWPSGLYPHGTSCLEVERIGLDEVDDNANILYMTDSHLGKSTHGYGADSWPVSPSKGFKEAVDEAIRRDVDAVIHGGDLFHNSGKGIQDEEVRICTENLTELADSGIPFYFIYGNHEREAGRRVMNKLVDKNLAVHLGPRYQVIENSLAVYGVDYKPEWGNYVPDFETPPQDMKTLLCLHQSVDPFTQRKDPDCSVSKLREQLEIPIDLIMTGHVHTDSKTQVKGTTAVAGGATARLGKQRDDTKPSSRIISINHGELEIEQTFL